MNSIRSGIFSNKVLVSTNIISLDVTYSVNKIPFARAVVCDGGEENKNAVELSGETCFQPGQEVEISLEKGDTSFLFKGFVVKQKIHRKNGKTVFTVDIKDKAHRLTLLRQSKVFKDKEDKQIINDLAAEQTVSMAAFSGTTVEHKQLVQYYCTNWDFIVTRAEANGLLVCMKNGELALKKPEPENAASDLTGILEYEIETDLGSQYGEVESVCWDIKEAKPVKFSNSNKDLSLGGTHNFAELSKNMGAEKLNYVSGIYGLQPEMEAWANAGITRNRFSFLRGRVSVEGNTSVNLGDTVNFSNAGDLFSGKTIISGIRHRIDENGWVTDLQCGLSPRWFYKSDDIEDKSASGLIPGINGLQTGIVEPFPSDGDPDGLHRIQVRIPVIDEKESVIWARLLFPYAGDTRGVFWVPEEGDEVVIGFFNDDPRHAVVLGALYNGKTTPPLDFSEENNEKGIITRNGIKMIFTDEKDKEKIEISTPGNNKVFIEDEKGITVQDSNESVIVMDDKGVSLEDKNKNKVVLDDKGIKAEDTNKNVWILSSEGTELSDLNGNSIIMSSGGVEIKDLNGNKIVLDAGGITIDSPSKITVKGSQVDIN